MSGSKVKGFDCLPSGWPTVAEATDGVTRPTDQITGLPGTSWTTSLETEQQDGEGEQLEG